MKNVIEYYTQRVFKNGDESRIVNENLTKDEARGQVKEDEKINPDAKYYMLVYDKMNITNHDPFIAHGGYTISNACGYLVQISESNDSARLEINTPESKHYILTDWMEIEYIIDEDSIEEELIAVIDPDGYNVPLNLVMRINN